LFEEKRVTVELLVNTPTNFQVRQRIWRACGTLQPRNTEKFSSLGH